MHSQQIYTPYSCSSKLTPGAPEQVNYIVFCISQETYKPYSCSAKITPGVLEQLNYMALARHCEEVYEPYSCSAKIAPGALEQVNYTVVGIPKRFTNPTAVQSKYHQGHRSR